MRSELTALAKAVDDVKNDVSNMQGRNAGIMAAIGVFFTVVQIALRFL